MLDSEPVTLGSNPVSRLQLRHARLQPRELGSNPAMLGSNPASSAPTPPCSAPNLSCSAPTPPCSAPTPVVSEPVMSGSRHGMPDPEHAPPRRGPRTFRTVADEGGSLHRRTGGHGGAPCSLGGRLRILPAMAWVKVPPEHHPLFRAALPDDPRVETQAMFGGVAAKVNGHIFAGLFGRSTMVLLSEPDRAAALAYGATMFDPMGDGRARSDKVMLPERAMHDPTELRAWIARAFEATAALPPKAAKSTRAKKPRTAKKPAAAKRPATAKKAPAKRAPKK